MSTRKKLHFSLNNNYHKDDDNRYIQLNLNQNHKPSNILLVQAQTKSNGGYKYYAAGNFEDKRSLKRQRNLFSINGLYSKISDSSLNFEDDKKETEKSFKINSYNSTSNSTLSLHIAAYENSLQNTCQKSINKNVLKDSRKELNKKIEKKILIGSSSNIQNTFEFPRQQDPGQMTPEVTNFKASQRLLDSNKSTASSNKHKRKKETLSESNEGSSIFIVDNGSYSIKAGHKDDLKPKIIPNYIFKTSSDSYIGNEIDKCLEPSNLYLNSPFERGYLVHMDIQNEIWQDIFGRRQFGLDFSDTKLVLTDSNLTVPTIETSVREILFETYGFHSLQLASAPGLVAQYYYEKTQIPHSLIIDSGHSFTHILPCLSGKICVERSMRIDVGGKIMTNFLRDKLTYSQYDLRQETKVVNEMKEDVCYFAKDFRQEMEIFKKNNPVINYYLPDYNLIRRGQIKQSSDSESFKDLSTISLGVERFVLPETIFFPEIIDCDQIGLKEAINRTCNGVFNYNLFGRYMLKNIIVFGGNASIPGLKERLCHDLSNAFETYDVPENLESCINISSHPISEPWFAAQYLINNNVPSFLNKFVSKKEYHEHGNRICDERFIDYAPKEWYEHVEDGPFVDENGMSVMDSDDEFETTCNSKVEKPVTFENQVTDQINISSSSNAATIVHDQFSNDIVVPQSPTNDVDTDIIEIDYVPPSTRPIIRTILKPRRAVPSVGTVSIGQQPTILQKVLPPQRLIKCPDQNSHLPNVQYYTTISEGSKPSRFIQLRPARIIPDFQQQQRFQSRLPLIPSSSIIRIRSPIASTSNIRSPNQQIPSSEMPILHPQIARQVPIMLPRGMLPSSSIGGPVSASFRGRTIVVRRTIPRSQYIALQQRHQQPSQQSVLVMPSANFHPQPGLEEEYESGESGPSTPL